MKKCILTAALFAAAVCLCQAQSDKDEQTVTLTEDSAVAYALENSLSIKSSAIDLEIKKRAGDNAWNVLLPTVQASGTLSRSGTSSYSSMEAAAQSALLSARVGALEKGSSLPVERQAAFYNQILGGMGYEDTESGHWTTIGNLGVSWNLSLAYIGQIKAAKADYEGGKITYEKSVRETEVNVRKLFYGLLLQQENIRIQKTSLENARLRAVQTETNFKNGLVPELSMLQAQVSYENKRPEVEQADRLLRQQLDTFAFIIGLPVGTSIVLDGSIEPEYVDVDVDTLIQKYSASSLDIKNLDATISSLKDNLSAINLSSYTPALALNYSLQPALIYGLDFDRYTDADNWNDSNSFSITLAWNLTNLLPWSSNRQNAKNIESNIKKLELSREMAVENQKVEVRKAVDTLTQARQQIDAMGRNIKLAQRSYEMTMRSYRNGTTELLDVRDAESQLDQAKLGLANQKFNYISALLDLEKTLNINLTSAKNEGGNK
ncbi:TolC family protein [uncultured Treponema sp.]|uniref:TolC family protein n=1 Tax=uncultured Treponema sp. TaxID=162155 RepID=UPI002590085D|nr:TolC family protein [uncultured Treponema sp.]